MALTVTTAALAVSRTSAAPGAAFSSARVGVGTSNAAFAVFFAFNYVSNGSARDSYNDRKN